VRRQTLDSKATDIIFYYSGYKGSPKIHGQIEIISPEERQEFLARCLDIDSFCDRCAKQTCPTHQLEIMGFLKK